MKNQELKRLLNRVSAYKFFKVFMGNDILYVNNLAATDNSVLLTTGDKTATVGVTLAFIDKLNNDFDIVLDTGDKQYQIAEIVNVNDDDALTIKLAE